MEAILVKPKNQKELNFFKEFFNKVNADFSLQKEKIPEGDIYYPELDKKIKKVLKREKEGKSVIYDTSNLDNFLKSIRDNE